MKTLITRPIDQLGRVVIPREILKNIGWKLKDGYQDGTILEFCVDGNAVMIREHKPTCHCCSDNATAEFYGVKLCETHLRLIVKNAENILKVIKA